MDAFFIAFGLYIISLFSIESEYGQFFDQRLSISLSCVHIRKTKAAQPCNM